MQLTQIGKLFELGLDKDLESNLEQGLARDTESLSFTDALETTQSLPEQLQDDVLQDAVLTQEDDIETENAVDPVLYLQQFLHLEDDASSRALSGQDALPQLNDVANKSLPTTGVSNDTADADQIVIAQDADFSSTSAPDVAALDLSFDAMVQSTLEQSNIEPGVEADIKENEPIADPTEKSPLAKSTQSLDDTAVKNHIERDDDTGRFQELAASQDSTKSTLLDEQSDGAMVKLAGAESHIASKAVEGAVATSNSRPVAQEFSLHTPVHQDEWGDEFNQRILWLGQQKIDKALLQLHPKDLGPVQVQIHMQDNQAHLQIQVNDALVQQRIQDSLPELKALLEMQGLGLGQASIDSQSRGQQGGERAPQMRVAEFDASTESTVQASPTRVLGVMRDGHVDTYA